MWPSLIKVSIVLLNCLQYYTDSSSFQYILMSRDVVSDVAEVDILDVNLSCHNYNRSNVSSNYVHVDFYSHTNRDINNDIYDCLQNQNNVSEEDVAKKISFVVSNFDVVHMDCSYSIDSKEEDSILSNVSNSTAWNYVVRNSVDTRTIGRVGLHTHNNIF